MLSSKVDVVDQLKLEFVATNFGSDLPISHDHKSAQSEQPRHRRIYKRKTAPVLRTYAHLNSYKALRSKSMTTADCSINVAPPAPPPLPQPLLAEISNGEHRRKNSGQNRPNRLSAVMPNSMNQLSSRDFFLVEFSQDLFDPNDKCPAELTEMILAIGGVQLREAVQGILERRNLLADRIHIFLESSKTPLPWETDTSFFGGHRLYVRAKESDSPFSRAQFPICPAGTEATTNSLPKANKKATKEPKPDKKPNIPPLRKKTLPEATLSLPPDPMEPPNSQQSQLQSDTNCSKKTLRPQGRLSQIFPNSLFKPESRLDIHERLSSYQTDVHPDFDLQLLPANRSMATAFSDFKLESHWSDITTNREGLSKRQAEQQEAIWELIETEFAYIHKLQLLSEYYGYLLRLQTECFLTEIDPELIFGNILEIYAANLYFWQIGVQPVLDHSRSTGEPLDPILLDPGFQEIHKIFQVYIRYTLIHAEMAQYVSKKQKESEAFREFVAWTQNQKCSSRLQLTDLLVKPMQRLTKYPLLLKAVLKNSGDLPTKAALACMIRNVEDFLSRINVELRYKQQLDALQHITSMIEGYDVIDSTSEELNRVLRQHSCLDLTIPMLGCHPKVLRILFLQGDLKLRDAYCKMDTHCFLFTDLFLVGKQMPRKGDRPRIKIVKQPFHIDRILIQELRESHGFAFIYLNEFGVASTAFTLQANNVIDGQKWLDFFRIAKESYQQYKDHPNDFSWLPHPIPFEIHSGVNGSSSGSSSGTNSLSKATQKLTATAPTSTGSFLTVDKTSPLRRISIGAMESARRKLTEIPSLSHGRSSSMDSNAIGLKAELSSADLSTLNTPSTENLNELSEALNCGTENSKLNREINSVHPTTEVGSFVESLQLISPGRRRKAASLSPSPVPPAFSISSAYQQCKLSPEVASSPDLLRQPSPSRTLSPPAVSSLHGSSETLVSHDQLGSKPSLSPPTAPRIPSPLYYLQGDTEPAVMEAESLLDLYDYNAAPTTPNLRPFPLVIPSSIASRTTSEKKSGDDNNNVNGHQAHPKLTCNRRLERRYHTADAIETRKITPTASSIRKRFSWNNFASKSKSTDESALLASKNGANHLSSDSFCSSSGVSSSSSQLCVSPTTTDTTGIFDCTGEAIFYTHGHCLLLETKSDATLKYEPLPEPPRHPPPPLYNTKDSSGPRHVSTVAIGDFDMSDDDDYGSCASRKGSDPVIPVIKTHTATPEQTPIATKPPYRFALNDSEVDTESCQPGLAPKLSSPHGAVDNKGKLANSSDKPITKDSLLKLILENQLEVSEV